MTSSCPLSNHGPPNVIVLVMRSTSCNYMLLANVFLHTVLFQQWTDQRAGVCCSRKHLGPWGGLPSSRRTWSSPSCLARISYCTVVNYPTLLLNSKNKALMSAVVHDSTLNTVLDILSVAALETCQTGWAGMWYSGECRGYWNMLFYQTCYI